MLLNRFNPSQIKSKVLLVIAFLVTAMPPAIAQVPLDFSSLSNASSIAATTHINGVIDRSARRATGNRRRKPPSTSQKPTPTATNTFSFSPSAEVSNRIRQRYLDKFAANGSNPRLRQILETQKWVKEFDEDFSSYGFKSNNVADVMTGYWVRLWRIVNDQPKPSRDQLLAVNQQFQEQLASTPDFARAPDQAKQELAEDMIYMQAMIFGTYLAVKNRGTSEQKQLLQQTIHQGLIKTYGMDLKRLELTNTGFQK